MSRYIWKWQFVLSSKGNNPKPLIVHGDASGPLVAVAVLLLSASLCQKKTPKEISFYYCFALVTKNLLSCRNHRVICHMKSWRLERTCVIWYILRFWIELCYDICTSSLLGIFCVWNRSLLESMIYVVFYILRCFIKINYPKTYQN